MMMNPKTTIAGYCLIAASVLTFVAHVLQTGTVSMIDLNALVGVLSGLGLVAAKDGGH